MQIVAGARHELGMRQLYAVIRHSDDASGPACNRPGRPDVQINAERSAVPSAILQVPLIEEVGVVGFGGIRSMLPDLLPPPDRAAHQHFRPRGQPLRLVQRCRRIAGLENKKVRRNDARELERTALQNRLNIRSRL